jgi:hypothetical protein
MALETFDYNSASYAPTPGPRRGKNTKEEDLVFRITEVLDQRTVATETISYGLQTQEFHVQQRLMDIILELLNLWRIDATPETFRLYPNHPLRSVYETANRMLAALEVPPPPPPPPPSMEDTGPIPVVDSITNMVENLPRNNRR